MGFNKTFLTAIGLVGAGSLVSMMGLPNSAQAQMTPGQTIPGQTIPGQTTPGQVIPGQTTPGQVIPGQTIPGQATPGATTTPAPTIDPPAVPDPTFPADPVFPGDFTPAPGVPATPGNNGTPQTPTQVAPPEIQIVPPETTVPQAPQTQAPQIQAPQVTPNGATTTPTPPSVQVIPSGGRVIISNPSATPTILEVVPSQVNDSNQSTIDPTQGQAFNEGIPSLQSPTEPIAPSFAPAECAQGEVYVNLPRWGGGACLLPGQFNNIAQ
jgi:hypothetical protein